MEHPCRMQKSNTRFLIYLVKLSPREDRYLNPPKSKFLKPWTWRTLWIARDAQPLGLKGTLPKDVSIRASKFTRSPWRTSCWAISKHTRPPKEYPARK